MLYSLWFEDDGAFFTYLGIDLVFFQTTEALPGTSRASEPVYPVGTLMARRREQIRRAALAAAAQQADPEVLDLRIARQQPPATPPPAARPQARIVTPDIFRPSPERQGESPGAVRPPATPGRRSPTPPLAATPPIPARPHTPDNDVSDEDSPDEAEQAQRVLADVGPDDGKQYPSVTTE
ncbi:translation initiation factor IF-2-like [Frankliniella occidentalis]|uniref:Translation initiation factor IF-2-like n=1 Tax=Frankliniella occidentalis TaxID=133901 RepID=A0A9C6XUN2_FRAOC|nr:translation initiation factor IF-2-like [Frankliniella occidentalis]